MSNRSSVSHPQDGKRDSVFNETIQFLAATLPKAAPTVPSQFLPIRSLPRPHRLRSTGSGQAHSTRAVAPTGTRSVKVNKPLRLIPVTSTVPTVGHSRPSITMRRSHPFAQQPTDSPTISLHKEAGAFLISGARP